MFWTTVEVVIMSLLRVLRRETPFPSRPKEKALREAHVSPEKG